jgi:hypothetical protein
VAAPSEVLPPIDVERELYEMRSIVFARQPQEEVV